MHHNPGNSRPVGCEVRTPRSRLPRRRRPRPAGPLRLVAVAMAAMAAAAAKPARPAAGTALQSAAVQVRFDAAGAVTALKNRLTNETLSLAAVHSPAALIQASGRAVRLKPSDFQETTARSGTVRCSWARNGVGSVTLEWRSTSRGPAAGLLLRPVARASRPGLRGVRWTLGGIPDRAATLLVPAWSGFACRGNTPPFQRLDFSWPSSWEAGMILVQMERGGFLIFARDPGRHYKNLVLRHGNRRFSIEFGFENFAPFNALAAAESFPWCIAAYRGDWRAGARLYREWARKTLGLTPLSAKPPAWARNIRFVTTVGLDPAVIRELARRVPPRSTLLYVPTWRRDPYDKNYPDYTANPRFPAFVRAAHRLGFRVMVHVNYLGCDFRNPLYARFQAYQLRAPGSGKRLWWIPPSERNAPAGHSPRIKFAYIHPGCTAWRRLLVGKFVEIVQKYHVDALHLDQTLLMPNHNGGRVDGQTVIEGNLALHRELRSRLPQVALSGEGLDEITARYENFAQRHAPRSVDHTHGAWDNAFLDAVHPISSFLLLPYCKMYGYLGMAGPRRAQLYRAWRRAYAAWGVLPTLNRPSEAALRAPGPDLRLLLEEAGAVCRDRLDPDLSIPRWPPDLRFCWTGPGGRVLTYRASAPGLLTCRLGSKKAPAAVLYRYVSERSEYRGPGTIPGWPVYDARRVMGLDPRMTWLVLPEQRNPAARHIDRLPDGAVVREFRSAPDRLICELRSRPFLRLLSRVAQAETGILVDGRRRPLDFGACFQRLTITCGGVQKPAIFAHPPWRWEPGKPPPKSFASFGRFRAALPRKPAMALSFYIGLRDGVNGRSDGVDFRVTVNGKTRFRQHWRESRWSRHTLSLAAFAGKTVTIGFFTGPGPAGNVQCDWAAWGNPVIRPAAGMQGTVELAAPEPPRAMFAAGRAAPVRSLAAAGPAAGVHRFPLTASLPGTFGFLWRPPVPVSGARVDLTALTPAVSAAAFGRPLHLPARYVSFHPGAGVARGEKRPGFVAHPPDFGRVFGEFFLRLPKARRITLTFAVALADRSRSRGCEFLVQADLRTVFRRLVTGPDGWHPAQIDLSRYAGQAVLLGFGVDSAGSHYYDWARWAAPALQIEP